MTPKQIIHHQVYIATFNRERALHHLVGECARQANFDANAAVEGYVELTPDPNDGISRNKIPGRGGDGEGIERTP